MSCQVTYSPHCAVCVNVNTAKPSKGVTQIKGYWTCHPHAAVMEHASSLTEALREVRRHNAIRGGK